MTSFAPAHNIKDRRHDSRDHGLPSGAEPRAFVLLKSRRRLDLLNPDPNAWTDEDLAAGLSRTMRWGGLSRWEHPLSVAQHSLTVLTIREADGVLTPGEALRELLHDTATSGRALNSSWMGTAVSSDREFRRQEGELEPRSDFRRRPYRRAANETGFASCLGFQAQLQSVRWTSSLATAHADDLASTLTEAKLSGRRGVYWTCTQTGSKRADLTLAASGVPIELMVVASGAARSGGSKALTRPAPITTII